MYLEYFTSRNRIEFDNRISLISLKGTSERERERESFNYVVEILREIRVTSARVEHVKIGRTWKTRMFVSMCPGTLPMYTRLNSVVADL